MPRQLSRISSIATLVVMLCSCGPAISEHRLIELPSGRTLRVLSIRDVPLDGDRAALRLAYETDLALDDRLALFREVEAIWDEFRSTEAAAGKAVAVIEATTPEARGWSRERKAVKYTLRLGPEGRWSFVNADPARGPS